MDSAYILLDQNLWIIYYNLDEYYLKLLIFEKNTIEIFLDDNYKRPMNFFKKRKGHFFFYRKNASFFFSFLQSRVFFNFFIEGILIFFERI